MNGKHTKSDHLLLSVLQVSQTNCTSSHRCQVMMHYLICLHVNYKLLPSPNNHPSGTTDYLCGIDRGDITFVEQYTVAKPVPVPLEFIDLVEIIMQENNLTVPQTIVDALALYIELINSVEE